MPSVRDRLMRLRGAWVPVSLPAMHRVLGRCTSVTQRMTAMALWCMWQDAQGGDEEPSWWFLTSAAEVAEFLGVKSRANVHRYLRSLVDSGVVEAVVEPAPRGGTRTRYSFEKTVREGGDEGSTALSERQRAEDPTALSDVQRAKGEDALSERQRGSDETDVRVQRALERAAQEMGEGADWGVSQTIRAVGATAPALSEEQRARCTSDSMHAVGATARSEGDEGARVRASRRAREISRAESPPHYVRGAETRALTHTREAPADGPARAEPGPPSGEPQEPQALGRPRADGRAPPAHTDARAHAPTREAPVPRPRTGRTIEQAIADAEAEGAHEHAERLRTIAAQLGDDRAATGDGSDGE